MLTLDRLVARTERNALRTPRVAQLDGDAARVGDDVRAEIPCTVVQRVACVQRDRDGRGVGGPVAWELEGAHA